MASNTNGIEFANLPKSNESNIIAHNCAHCGYKNYIMITSINLTDNSIDSRKRNFNISFDQNIFESNPSDEILDEQIDSKLKIENNFSGSDQREVRKPRNETHRSSSLSDERPSQSSSSINETETKKPIAVSKSIPFNETQFANDLKSLIRVPPNSQDGNTIGKYFLNSQQVANESSTANNNKFEITNVFSPYKKGREPILNKRYLSDRRLLLWFGIKKEVLFGMLNNKLFELPIINGKLGNGYYFSDSFLQSIKYCDRSNGFLLLCEVAVGKMHRFGKVKSFSSPPHGYDSIKFVGKYMPDKQRIEKYNKDVIVPIGKTVKNPKVSDSEFDFSKYVVFDERRIQIRFIVEFEKD